MCRAQSAVVYDGLPLSAGGAHGLGRVTARGALRSWVGFLNARTESSPVVGWFDFPDTPGLALSPDLRRQIEVAFPSQGQRCAVPWARADEAIDLFESVEPLLVNEWGMAPVWLWFTADIRLLQPETGEPWPGQDRALFDNFVTPGGVELGASSTRLILQAKKSIGLSLSIPHATDSDLDTYMPWLQASLPLRLSSKHWSRWTATKRDDSYRGHRVALAP